MAADWPVLNRIELGLFRFGGNYDALCCANCDTIVVKCSVEYNSHLTYLSVCVTQLVKKAAMFVFSKRDLCLEKIFLFAFSVLAVPVLNQSPISDPVSAGETIRLNCGMQIGNLASYYVNWYRQRPGDATVWVLHENAAGGIARSPGFTDRFQPYRDKSGNNFILTIRSLEPGDSAVYYCQVWDSSTGGITAIQSSEDRSPSVLLLPLSLEEIDSGWAALSCLVSDFEPGFLRVLWNVDGKETGSRVRTSPVSRESDQTYRLSSYPKVPATDLKKGSTYSCSVSHGSLNSPLLESVNSGDCSISEMGNQNYTLIMFHFVTQLAQFLQRNFFPCNFCSIWRTIRIKSEASEIIVQLCDSEFPVPCFQCA
ncbi:immunoglobulin kappa light chain-like [Mustelus asterias]